MQVDLSRYVNRNPRKLRRLLWDVIWLCLALPTPRWMLNGWRGLLLKAFGANLGKGVRVQGGARVWYPGNLTIGENSWVGDGANLYCVAPITIGANAVVSEYAFVCTAEHDIASERFELKTAPIVIGDMAWIGARAMILPGRKVGEGAVVAAGAMVTHDVAPWTVVAGNPARVISRREIKAPSVPLTIVIPVKNEELNLPSCLDCLRNFPYVLLVDSGSEDRTIEIFDAFKRSLGDRGAGWESLRFTWNGRYPKKRNWVLDNYRFKTEWVMFLDADELLTSSFVEELMCVLSSLPATDDPSVRTDAFICYYDNLFLGRMLRHGDVMHKTAILRVGHGSYEKVKEERTWSSLDMEIHEQLVVEGRTGVLRTRLEHHDRRSLAQYLAKHEEYASWEANRYRTLTPDHWSQLTRRQILKYRYVSRFWFAIGYFIVSYFLKLGFLDGRAGFWFAWHKMRYFANMRRKIVRDE